MSDRMEPPMVSIPHHKDSTVFEYRLFPGHEDFESELLDLAWRWGFGRND